MCIVTDICGLYRYHSVFVTTPNDELLTVEVASSDLASTLYCELERRIGMKSDHYAIFSHGKRLVCVLHTVCTDLLNYIF